MPGEMESLVGVHGAEPSGEPGEPGELGSDLLEHYRYGLGPCTR